MLTIVISSNYSNKPLQNAGCGVRTHAHLSAGDLKSPPLTTRANQLLIIYICICNILLLLFQLPSLSYHYTHPHTSSKTSFLISVFVDILALISRSMANRHEMQTPLQGYFDISFLLHICPRVRESISHNLLTLL